MNLIRRSKKSTDVTANAESPLNEIGDVSAVAAMFAQLRQQNTQYQQAINALVAARRVVNGWDKPEEPDLSLSIQREVLVSLGDDAALVKFDQAHGQQLADEQAARLQRLQQTLEAPARVKAIEQYLKDLAAHMVANLDETLIDQEMRRIFRPSAERMLVAAKAFVQAWREMNTVAYKVTKCARLTHSSVHGDYLTRYDLDLISARRDGEFLPTLIEGLTYEELADLNRQINALDNDLAHQLDGTLTAAGVDGSGIKIYRPGSPQDERGVYAHDPNPPKKYLEPAYGPGTVVRIDT